MFPNRSAFPWAAPEKMNRRRVILSLMLLVFLVLAWFLELSPAGLFPSKPEQWDRTREFFGSALRPAMDYQDENVPDDAPHILVKGLLGLFLTVKFAFGAMSMAVPAGLILGFFSSSAWWPQPCNRVVRFWLSALFAVSRLFMSLCRSIHELIWALLLLSALGVSPLAGMVALAIPFSGTLGKVFSELIDEESRRPAAALQAIGHRPAQVFLVGILPTAWPNLITYSFYRFECALRSSAVLGFVGIETIGLYIELSHEEFYYREVWTYLYLLLALIVIVDFWGARIRTHLHGDSAAQERRWA